MPRLPEQTEAKGAKLWDLGERISNSHLQAQGFAMASWPGVKGKGMEGEAESATPDRVSLTGAGKGSPSEIGEEPTEPSQ